MNQLKSIKMKILTYGDNPKISTGYGQVWDNLLTRWCKLKPSWEFYHLGWQSRDRPHKRIEGYTLLPVEKLEYGFDTVVPNISKYNPDIIVTLCDVGYQSGFINQIYEAKKRGWKGKWIAYVPIDTHSWAMTWDEVFDAMDVPVAMAKWGEKIMKANNVKKEIVTIPHGVDIKIYHPLENREQLKAKYNLQNLFVIGFVGRNQRRKRLDVLINGFKLFAKDKEDVLLMLHTDVEPVQAGWSLPYLQWKYKLKDKLKLTKTQLDIHIRQKIQPTDMNEIYNLMDVFCFPTGGEGFGLPAIECQASGVPLMQTAHCTGFELTGHEIPENWLDKPKNKGHGILIPVLRDIHNRPIVEVGTNGVEFVEADSIKLAEQLEELYQDWKKGGEKLKKMGKKAREFALKYSWDLIALKWLELFEKNAR